MDCEDVTLLLAALEERDPTAAETLALNAHAEGCRDCRMLLDTQPGVPGRAVVSVPSDALDDRDLLVLPVVDPSLFAVDRELARGGMGRVLRARDRRLGRDIALKEVVSPGLRARFEREAMITAQLQHPAIIPVYEAGTWPDGSPFYAMRLVAGGTLADAIGKTTTLEQRIALLPHVVAATDALAYAHSRGIVHRDLKPGNVLVGEFGETVVIDWGLAKQLDRDGADRARPTDDRGRDSGLTMAGSVLGTPGFMAPEQALGEEVDERADVYALGAILYNVLSGYAPYLDGPVATSAEMLARVRERPPTPIAELAPEAPRDLCAIVERAMARDRGTRLRTAKEMADELHRFQAGQLLRSRTYGMRELLVRWLRRHRAAVGVAAIALVVLAVGAIASVREIVHRRDEALHALALGRLEQGRHLLVDGEPGQATPYLAAAVAALPDDRVARRLATIALRDAERRVARFHGRAAAFSPDGRALAVGHDDGSVDVADATSGRVSHTLAPVGGAITCIAYAHGGATIVTASGAGAYARELGGSGTTTLARAAVNDLAVVGDDVVLADARGVRVARLDGTPVAEAALPGADKLDIAPDGRTVLAIGKDGTRAWSLPELTVVADLPAAWYARLDGHGGVVLAIYDVLERVTFASPAAPIVLARGPAQAIVRLADRTLATAGHLVDPETGTTRAFTPDGMLASIDATHLVAGGYYDGVARVWDLRRTARPIAVFDAAEGTGGMIAASDGTRLVSIGRSGTIELWDVTRLRALDVLAQLDAEVVQVVVTSRGLATARRTGDARGLAIVDERGARIADVSGWIVGSANEQVVVNDNGRLFAYSARDGARVRVIAGPVQIGAAALSPSGAVLATSEGPRVVLRDARSGDALASFDTMQPDVSALAVDDAGHVVTGHDDGAVRIWRARDGRAIATLLGHGGHVGDVAIRGDRLFVGSWDRTLRRCAFPSGDGYGVVLADLPGDVAISPDGHLVAVTSHAPVVEVWDADGGRLLERIPTIDATSSATFADDDHVVVGEAGGAIERIELGERVRDRTEIARLARAARWQLVDGLAVEGAR